MHNKQNRNNHGFTLVELSIVIIIIGLIVAGVVSGQSLIKQSQIRQQLSDITNYRVSFNTFKLQYSALPGDMINASSYWSACTDSTGNTCNGNDNSQITYAGLEGMRAWQHLFLSGILPQNFSGINASTATESVAGLNAPEGRVSNSCVTVDFESGSWGSNNSKNILIVGSPTSSDACITSAFVPADAINIDRKSDDGISGTGNTTVTNGNGVTT